MDCERGAHGTLWLGNFLHGFWEIRKEVEEMRRKKDMKIETKFGLAALAVALTCGPMVAQEGPDPAGAPADEALLVPPGGPGGPGAEGFVDQDGPGGPRAPMGPGAERHDRFERGPQGGHREFALSRLLSDPEIQQKVGISADQVAKIRQQESAFRKTEIRQRADLEIKRIDLRDMLAAEKPDRAAIDRQLQEISTSQLAIEKARIDFRLNMKDALTPDQREKLRQTLRERWQARRGPGMRAPQGTTPGNPTGDAQGPEPKPGE
jgi:Spy/CpxP family protein refolding chaperone